MDRTPKEEVVSNTLAISDLHFPFVHKDSLDFVLTVAEKFDVDTFVGLGDELDNHAQSAYTIDADGFSAGHELERAIKKMEPWRKAIPEIMWCKSNHPKRTFARLQEAQVPKRFWRPYSEVLEAPPGWKWKDHWTIDDVVYEHGHNAGGEHPHANVAKANHKSTVIGHHHGRFGIWWHRGQHSLIFGMVCGWLGDEKAYSMAYGREHKVLPVLGVGLVLDQTPVLVRMITNGRGRWTRELGIQMVEP